MEGEEAGGEDPEILRLREDGDVVKNINDPMLPSEEEVKEHYEMGHSVCRSWCSICVRSRSKEWGHRKDSGKDRNLSEYAFDYCFAGDECGYKWTVLVGKERKTGMMMATT
eukprot:10619238-Karenia_brevis.AAC.1